MSEDEFEEDLSWEHTDGSRQASGNAPVEQQYLDIQDRLTRIKSGIATARTELARLREKLVARIQRAPVLPAAADHLAGDHNPFRG